MFKNFKDTNEHICYMCDKSDNMKKAFEANWEDDSSSSESEKEAVNMCFPAEEVYKSSEYIEILTVLMRFMANLNKLKRILECWISRIKV